jgi:predicted nucleic acid-binding protein
LIVVSDTSPLLNLARIGYLELLVKLYGQVVIPPRVEEELIRVRNEFPTQDELFSASWLAVVKPSDLRQVDELSKNLDAGEAEAIALAIEHNADLLLIDERRGRRVAAERGLKLIGLLGVLVSAKQSGYIRIIKPLLDDLIQTARFWIGPELYAEVLKQSGE